MTHYRLLRDNKETGPYSEEDMIAKGFKPYDLIWVEGRSAGWRYPSEIPAFKNHAPAIEEQPYDRFYKKQPPQKLFAAEEKITQSSPSYYNAVPVVAKTNEQYQPQPAAPVTAKQTTPPQTVPAQQSTPDYTIQSIPGRHIHVTLPSGNTVNLSTIVARKETKEEKEIAETSKPPAYTEIKQPVIATPAYTLPAAVVKEPTKEVPAAFVINEPLADEQPEPVYIHQPVSALPLAGFSWSLVAAACIGIATLVGLGIMIGLGISRDKNDKAFNEALLSKSKQTSNPSTNRSQPSASNTVTDETTPPTDEPSQPSSAPVKELVQNAVVKSTVANTETKKLAEEKIIPEKNKPLPNHDQPLVNNKPVPVAINIEKHLSVTPNDFKTGAFGGISGLKYTLINNSKFPIESVEVEIDYIQANDKIYKTERVLFKDISAGAQSTIEAPPSSRGIKLSARIIKVNTREGGISNTTAKS